MLPQLSRVIMPTYNSAAHGNEFREPQFCNVATALHCYCLTTSDGLFLWQPSTV